jgi:hypothetical protein
MEHLPPRSPDEEPHGPENEQLWPGEIDLTGTTRQDDALADVIGDAIGEAEASNGEVPDWGARSLARALANERDDPLEGALHHFAVTGRADPEAIARELADLYQATTDEQIREWINWLGTYVIRLPDESAPTEHAHGAEPSMTSDGARAPETAETSLPVPFAGKYAPGEVIDTSDARSLATMLSMFLNPGSELARFADTGDANPVLLSQECQTVRRFTEHVPGAGEWITRFEQHLAARSDLGRHPQPPDSRTSAGRSEHDDLAAEGLEALVFGDELDVVRAYLNMTFARADARGESISEDGARYLAKLLAAILGPDSAMKRFAESGEGNLHSLQQECRQLTSQQWPTADITAWAQRFEQYLASSPSPPTPPPTPETPTEPDNPQVAQGIREHGAAFQAFLTLPDIQPGQDDLLRSFHDCYIGVHDSMDAVVRELTEGVIGDDEQARWAADGVTLEDLVRAAWDVVELDGKFYVFNQ